MANKCLLAGVTCMPEMHLRMPGFICSACGPFAKKSKEWINKFKETGDSRYIYQKELDKTCFQHDMAYGDFKDLTRRTASDKILHDKHLILLKMWTMDINMYLLKWSTNILINKIVVNVLKMRVFRTKN